MYLYITTAGSKLWRLSIALMARKAAQCVRGFTRWGVLTEVAGINNLRQVIALFLLLPLSRARLLCPDASRVGSGRVHGAAEEADGQITLRAAEGCRRFGGLYPRPNDRGLLGICGKNGGICQLIIR